MIYDSENGEITVTLGGDFLLSRRLAVFKEERFLQLRELFRTADVGFVNFETSAHKYGEGVPSISAGTYMTTEPWLLGDTKWFGINLVACANNHCFDWGEEGIVLNNQYLDQAGIVHAGTGRNLREAVSPGYLDTPNGRVALIAATSMLNDFHVATNQRSDMHGKPGVNPLGYKTTYTVDREAFDALRRIGRELPFDAQRERWRAFGFFSTAELGAATDTEYNFLGSRFVVGESFAVQTDVNERHAEENLRQIREARRQADWVIFSLHNHEMGGKTIFTAKVRSEMEEPPQFMVDFAHRAIDEGVDVFVGHGPHVTLGMEIYKGKPIFYSLGDFVMQNETARFFPSYSYDRFGMAPSSTPADFIDARSDCDRKAHAADPLFWETVVPVCGFKSGKLAEVVLHPVDVGFGKSRSKRGRPLIASTELGREILSRMVRLSKVMGTQMDIADNKAYVKGL